MDESFGPWMLVNRRQNRSRIPQRLELKDGQRHASRPGFKPAAVTPVRQHSRYAAIEDLDEDGRLVREDDDMVPAEANSLKASHKHAETSLGYGPSVKSQPKGNARMTASKQQGQLIEIGTKLKIQQKAKDKKSYASTSGPKSDKAESSNASLPTEQVGPDQQVHTTSNESPPLSNAALDGTCTSTNANGHVGLLDLLNQAGSIIKSGGSSNANKASDLHMGPKKAIGKKSKYKGPRTHVIVQGNLNSVPKQASLSSNIIKVPSREHNQDESLLEQNPEQPQPINLQPPGHWDPNEDVTPDFMENNGTSVPETPPEQMKTLFQTSHGS